MSTSTALEVRRRGQQRLRSLTAAVGLVGVLGTGAATVAVQHATTAAASTTSTSTSTGSTSSGAVAPTTTSAPAVTSSSGS